MGRVWYLAALIPLALGFGIAAVEVVELIRSVDDLPRVVVPGKGEVTLAAGDYSVFGESRSTYAGTVYVSTSLELRCTIGDGAAGPQPELTAPHATESYEVGAFAGRAMYRLHVPRAGTFQVACEGQGGPSTIAFGTSIIRPLLVGLAGGLGGFFTACGMFTVVFVRRRNALRAATQP